MTSNHIGFVRTEDGISVFLDGTSYNVSRNHANYKKVIEAINNSDAASLRNLVDIPKAANVYSEGAVEIQNGVVKWNGEEIHNAMTQYLLRFMEEDAPFKPLARFFDKLMNNPSRWSVEQAYPFLEHHGFIICPDGDFLAYKSVTGDFLDHHTKTVKNTVGAVISCRRNEVDDDPNKDCSYGYHVGTYQFASTFMPNSVLVLCKINPADIVSVPKDANCQKCRVCRYEVVEVYEQKKASDNVYRPDPTSEVSFASSEDECHPGLGCDDVDCECHDDEYEDEEDYDCNNCGDMGCDECEDVFDESDVLGEEDNDSDFDEDDVYPPSSNN